jgi:hypothetical protein
MGYYVDMKKLLALLVCLIFSTPCYAGIPGAQYSTTAGVFKIGTLPVNCGGTGLAALTAHYILLGNGTSAATLLSPGSTSNYPLVSQGAGADPIFNYLPVSGGGTGLLTIAQHGIIIGAGISTPSVLSPSFTSGIPIISQGPTADPIYGTVSVSGGGTGVTSLTGHGVVVMNSGGTAQTTVAPSTSGNVLSSNGTDWTSGAPTVGFPTGLIVNDCRTYLVSGSPYADGSSSGNTSILFGPCSNLGKYLTVDDGSGNLSVVTVTEISLSLSSGFTSGHIYDLYAKNTAGTLSLDSTTWSTNTPPSRSTDAAGRLTKSSATNELLVGAFYMIDSTHTADWIGERHVSNLYNRTPKQCQAFLGTTSWTLTSGSANQRAVNSNTTDGQGRFAFTQCLATDGMRVFYKDFMTNAFVTGGSVWPTDTTSVGFQLDGTSAFDAQFPAYYYGGGIQSAGELHCEHTYAPQVGQHFIQALEYNTSGTTTTFYGTLPLQELGAVINN